MRVNMKRNTYNINDLDDPQWMFSETRQPSELRHVRHWFGKSLQHGGGPSKRNTSSFFLTELSVFSQEGQSILTHKKHISFSWFQCCKCDNMCEVCVCGGTHGEDGVTVVQSGSSLTGVAGNREHHDFCFICLLLLKDTEFRLNGSKSSAEIQDVCLSDCKKWHFGVKWKIKVKILDVYSYLQYIMCNSE